MITPYTVDLTPNRGTPAVVHVSQDDIKRLLVFKVVDDAGTDWAETNCSFTLRGRKPSKLGFQVDGAIAHVQPLVAPVMDKRLAVFGNLALDIRKVQVIEPRLR